MPFDPHAYAIQTRRILENGEPYFKATVAELPHLATYESSPQEAYDVLIEDIEALYLSSVELGHDFPSPQPESTMSHSGRITLRLPKTLHSNLDKQALCEGVSLNLHVVALLTEGSTAKNVALQAGLSIGALAKTAIASTTPLRGEDPMAHYTSSTGYSSTTHAFFSEKEESKWTPTQH